ncbi:hypothetical protein, partial [Kaarinaea lacus]
RIIFALPGKVLFLAWPRKSTQKEGHPISAFHTALRRFSLSVARRRFPVPRATCAILRATLRAYCQSVAMLECAETGLGNSGIVNFPSRSLLYDMFYRRE